MLTVSEIEEQIRTRALVKRIRPEQYFIDFDSLRSGNVTETQFFRILCENLDLKLSPQEETVLADRYRVKGALPKGAPNISYRNFCKVINNPAVLEGKCETMATPKELFGTTQSINMLMPEDEARILVIIGLLHKVYKFRGVDIRTACKNFDWSHRGLIEKSQFYRSLPKAAGINHEDMSLLTRKYASSEGLFNYINFNNDIEAYGSADKEVHVPVQHLTKLHSPQHEMTLQEIFDKIKVAVYKYGIRTFEYFKDYDKLRIGEVTAKQFESALYLAVGKEAMLTKPQVIMICNSFRTDDSDKVRYQEFCKMCEHAFNVPELEKQPTTEMSRPLRGELGRSLPSVGDYEERCADIIRRLQEQVRCRRILVYPYFKDFDRASAYSRVVTKLQFRRVLHFLELNLGDDDFALIAAKFKEPRTGDIDYPAFVQTIDQDFTNYGIDDVESQEELLKSAKTSDDLETRDQLQGDDTATVDSLMARIRHHVLTKRLRVVEFFSDFDKLRSGYITGSQFRRCLSDLGLSKLGEHDLNDLHFSHLFQYYGDPAANIVNWVRFCNDLDIVFTTPGLEKMPTYTVPPSHLHECPKPGTTQWQYASDQHVKLYDATMLKWSSRVKERRVLVKPLMQDFDLNNNGHITVQNFKQCLRMLELSTDANSMTAVVARFEDDLGLNYFRFLEALEPREKLDPAYLKRVKTLREQNTQPPMREFYPETDLISVLKKIKLLVVKQRIRVLEWMKDYDKMNIGRISRVNFRRAMDLCKLCLCESELAMLEDHYLGSNGEVQYRSFNRDIESSFTEYELERKPCAEVVRFADDETRQLVHGANELNDLAREQSTQVMNLIAEKVRGSRMQLFPLFEDFDRINNGTVTMLQFRRVLQNLQLADIVKTELQWNCLYERFKQRVGGKDMMNYMKFCDEIYEIGKFEWRKP